MSLYADMVDQALAPMCAAVHGDMIDYLPESGGTVGIQAVINASAFPDNTRGNASKRRRLPSFDCVISFPHSAMPTVVENADRVRIPGRLIRLADDKVILPVTTILNDPGSGRWLLGLSG